MKVRRGFVSNSSSSSFLIYGVCLKADEAERLLRENTDDVVFLDELDEYGVYEMTGSLVYASDGNTDGYYLYAGESWSCVKDDETGAQFKERVEKKLAELFGKGLSFGTHSAAWYNG